VYAGGKGTEYRPPKCWVDLRILGVTLFYVLKRDLHVKIHPCTVSYARYILQRNRATLYLGMFLRINHEQSQQLPTCYSINVHNVIAFVHFPSHFLLFSCFHLNCLWAVVTKALIKFVRSETATRAAVPTDKWCSTSYHRSAVTTSVSCTVSDILSLVWRTWMFVDDLD